MTGLTTPSSTEVLVVGAGLSGLSCARLLSEAGIDVHVIDAADAVGGRIRTDEVDGFVLDRGFQVLLTAYDEVQQQLDVDRLELRPFRSGSMIWTGERLETLVDPHRNPAAALVTLAAEVGSIGDKMRVASLRRRLVSRPPDACFEGPDRSTLEELRALGFTEEFIAQFFRPFLGGVFLERDLETSARLFRYYFRCFAAGAAAVPAAGMQRVPEQLAWSLGGRISLGVRARVVRRDGVTLDDGSSIEATHVVLAVDLGAAAALLGEPAPDVKAAVTSYFAAPEAPIDTSLLVLDGEGSGPANHVAVMSAVSDRYAPPGMHLVAVSGVDGAAEDADRFRAAVPAQMKRWFGDTVDRWTHLRTYRIANALPRHSAGDPLLDAAPRRRADGLVVAGDHTVFGSIQGALLSGRRAAETVLESFSTAVH